MAQKGQPFEREVCKLLSHWYSYGKDDDLFWRTAGSGGRGTVRGRKGKKTRSACGDIYATDEVGKSLTELITFEIKRGYSRDTLWDLLDSPKNGAGQRYSAWMDQAVESAANAGTPYWMIIHKRDKRRIVAVMPYQLFHQLGMLGAEFNGTMGITFFCKGWHLACIRLERFLQCVEPAEIKTLLRRFRNATH